jgi:hypothetical protein
VAFKHAEAVVTFSVVLKAKGQEILAKIERACKVALGEDNDVTII